MTSSLQTASSTNFDFGSLHLLSQEIHVILKDAEVHLREFYDDASQAPLLIDSTKNLNQLTKVFSLISFDGADLLAKALCDAYQKLVQTASNDTDQTAFIIDISEAVMTLERFVEFTLLKQRLEPSLLLPIINRLRAHLAQDAISTELLTQNSQSVVINNPSKQYAPLNTLGLDTKAITRAYRQGLLAVLSHQGGTLSPISLKHIQNMSRACANIAEHSDALFWQSAKAFTQDLAQDLPLSHTKKRILIYLEQQLADRFMPTDRRFAQLVSEACKKDIDFALLAHQKYHLNQTDASELKAMERLLFGPNHQIIDTINTLIQKDIEDIKQKVDTLVRTDGQVAEGEPITAHGIAKDISNLAKTLHLLGLNDARDALINASKAVNTWQRPSLEELDELLDQLLIAENSAIFLAKSHAPSAIKLPRHNQKISLHHLDVAYEALIKEARFNLLNISTILSEFLSNAEKDAGLHDTPELIRQVSGAMAFLDMPAIHQQLTKLAHKLEMGLAQKIKTLPSAEASAITHQWADVLVIADMALENLTQNRPANEQALLSSERSLNKLLVA